VIVSRDVDVPVVALLARFRIHVTLPGRDGPRSQVAEEARVLAFTGTPAAPSWLEDDIVADLLRARPSANVPIEVATNAMGNVLDGLTAMRPRLEATARSVAEELRDAHVRVRTAARGERAGALGVRGLEVRPQLPVDILGVYLYRPDGGRR
jgi:hypothetical protein